ncbi:MAG: FIST C-terminal domain-containing protein [Deltaproteobacteria bacterium]|nr:FIST C-terminal domain-containing protein [Deltaproteobacteria bacterium]
MTDIVSAYSKQQRSPEAARDLLNQLGSSTPKAIVFFASVNHDGRVLSQALRQRFPSAEVVGCSTCGEWTDAQHGKEGVALLALGGSRVRRCAGALARFDGGSVDAGIQAASDDLSKTLGSSLRELDPSCHVGIALLEGAHCREEQVNESLGNAAPLLSFVGGSAGDNLAFKQTYVYRNGEVSGDGAALLVMEMATPFSVVKACHFAPTSRELCITKAIPEKRIILEFDGRPAAQVYAEAVGVSPEKLDFSVFLTNPLGLMIQGKPWLRSVIRQVESGGLFFACGVLEGMRLSIMRGDDLVADTREALAAARKDLGGSIGGGLFFNCAYRMLEMDLKKIEGPYHAMLSGFPLAGFHTHGESWLGHINQTLTGLVFA